MLQSCDNAWVANNNTEADEEVDSNRDPAAKRTAIDDSLGSFAGIINDFLASKLTAEAQSNMKLYVYSRVG